MRTTTIAILSYISLYRCSEDFIDHRESRLEAEDDDNYNDIADNSLAKYMAYLQANQILPYQIPYMEYNIQEYLGLNLTDGVMEGFEKLQRSSSVYLDYEKNLGVSLPFLIPDVLIRFAYDFYIFEFKFKGFVVIKVKGVDLALDVIVDVYNYIFTLERFSIDNIRFISVELFGNPHLDWILNTLSKCILSVFHERIVQLSQILVQMNLERVFKEASNEEAVNRIFYGML